MITKCSKEIESKKRRQEEESPKPTSERKIYCNNFITVFPKLTKLHEDKSLLVDINWKNYFPYFSVFPHSQCFSFSHTQKQHKNTK